MKLHLPPLDGPGLLFVSTSIVFGLATLYAVWAILRRRSSAPENGEAAGGWRAASGDKRPRPNLRTVLEELIWVAVPLLMLLWLWRSI
jgi:hypothetical protein